ncbi:hypothetical protein BAUCODRAFT_23271 [Baudoinia panamericana UAMH 10762]|uniref:Uncharacterized protein n=1 Tax=Baudoinia panamericana (strain UAMH 10762) TaxID=717646 RepID=M2NGU8_BAUPA|nr:uncharacterized protein BAUCODRAFT_23271 [Baudoinia panamericana UAMH 10762]EMC98519.1 hypothetical protein BAUCODRAFT_23271 [Baudoinia panamericana UAMH 10762]
MAPLAHGLPADSSKLNCQPASTFFMRSSNKVHDNPSYSPTTTMSIARARALKGLQSAFRSSTGRATPRVSAPSRTALRVGRRYASGGDSHGAPAPDWPWAAGAVVVTIPACWYLWPSTHADAGHHGDHDEHAEHAEGGEEHHEEEEKEEAPQADTAPGEEAPKPEGEESQEQGEQKDESEEQGEKKEESEEQGEKKGGPEEQGEEKEESEADKPSKRAQPSKSIEETDQPAGVEGQGMPKTSDANKKSEPDEGSEPKEGGPSNTGGAQFKGGVREDSPGSGDERKREPDSKGAYKKRIDSGLQKNLGGNDEQFDEKGKETAASAKPPRKGSEGEISGKQAGLSNTPTRHSLQIDKHDDASTKPEGTPDTAKSMGTVDPSRPAKFTKQLQYIDDSTSGGVSDKSLLTANFERPTWIGHRSGKLPPELRNRIYELVLCWHGAIVLEPVSFSPRTKLVTAQGPYVAITATCRQTRTESLPILYALNEFELNTQALLTLCDSLETSDAKAIKLQCTLDHVHNFCVRIHSATKGRHRPVTVTLPSIRARVCFPHGPGLILSSLHSSLAHCGQAVGNVCYKLLMELPMKMSGVADEEASTQADLAESFRLSKPPYGTKTTVGQRARQ